MDTHVIEARGLSKRYGATTAVDRLDFRVEPGRVTGFLGPNGAGKSTTMRMILGLDLPTSGSVLVNGRDYQGIVWPLHEIGALLDARAVHPGRTAYRHLHSLAAANGIPRPRVDAVLEQVGLTSVAHRRVGGFSLGMSQRLGIAGALLGDPGILLFDEPVNGLDPDGILWIRTLMRSLAAEGRTVLVSSHLMSEMALTADHLLVIGEGRLLADTSLDELIARGAGDRVEVRAVERARLAAELREVGAEVTLEPDGTLQVTGVGSAAIGELAAARGHVLHQLRDVTSSLEEAYFRLTEGSVVYRAPVPA
ncbi:ABC transporter ATP-binding protein [Streptacidiphilus jiangxiensis]|uniref:ABC-2 type transport system ATP-binding protein n=1 Tax=Streptacidiphilus jiangxiensis TaxID=235985 RepID=A0A1H8AS62_STRJI|nr:ATP-binding cassette domain-containing protein [Streptacidiphilus jiangxiensis]SEM73366.1 ABC-2 type transport system ATP-binding protein [Streptacidiphilus jiangxiensis]